MCPCSGAARPGNVLLSSLLPCPGSRERALGEDVRCDKTGSSLAGDVLESTLRRGGRGWLRRRESLPSVRAYGTSTKETSPPQEPGLSSDVAGSSLPNREVRKHSYKTPSEASCCHGSECQRQK